MTRKAIKLPNALRDLDEAADFIGRRSSPERAIRFLRAADSVLKRLAKMPGLGTRYESADPAFADLRVAPVSRFKNYLIFYRPVADGIEVLRVLHGARDLHGILAAEFGTEEPEGPDAP